MWVIGYMAAMLAALMAAQALVLLAYRQPMQWTFGATSEQPRSMRVVLKVLLQVVMVTSILILPRLAGSDPNRYYAPILRPELAVQFLYGEVAALALLGLIFAVEFKGGWIVYEPLYKPRHAVLKSLRGGLSSLSVVAVEEPLFRGVLLQQLLFAAPPAAATGPVLSPLLAIPLSAAIFSAVHFIRRARTYWPAVGLAVLGIWLGVAYYKTGALWLPMGLHSGGVLAIQIHRCFTRYRGPLWLVGTDSFPVAGAIAMSIMLIGTVITWFVL